MDKMNEANETQIKNFMERFCKSESNRVRMIDYFSIKVMSYEQLLPANSIKSYATGNREIKNAFIIFSVIDSNENIVYYPVFSETVGRKLVKEWGLNLPSKMSVFTTRNGNDRGNNNHTDNNAIRRAEDNKQMLLLIQLARSMMILHVKEPGPMRKPFKEIYDKLESHPRYEVFARDIKSINTSICTFLEKPVNMENEKFTDLGQYIIYLEEKYPDCQLRNFEFELLREKMREKYPDQKIVF